MAGVSPKKPSSLLYGNSSPRSSPFSRTESPTVIRHGGSPSASPSRQSFSTTATPPPAYNYNDSPRTSRAVPPNPVQFISHSDPLSKVHPTQLQEMRESFHVLDRDSDGQVTRDDIVEMLNQLGQDSSPASVAAFQSGNMTLPAYLGTLSTLLAPLSSREELMAAFSAFDVDDSGQIDLAELREALVHTAAESGSSMSNSDMNAVLGEFTARRAFAKGMTGIDVGKRGEVFRYQDFIANLLGANGKNGGGVNGGAPQTPAGTASVQT